MPKRKVMKDEWYPVFSIDSLSGFGREVDVPTKLIKRCEKAFKEFDEVQEELRKLYGDA